MGMHSDKLLSASKAIGKSYVNLKLAQVPKQTSSRLNEHEKELNLFDSKKIDFKIVYLDISKSDKVELRINHKSFEFIPREILQHLQKVRESNLTSIDISNNKLQEIESTFLINLDLKNIEQIKADHNCLKLVSPKIKECTQLKCLRVSHNKLENNFLPTEFLNSGSQIMFLNLSNNLIKELPQNLGKL
jgi:hypothetical protein